MPNEARFSARSTAIATTRFAAVRSSIAIVRSSIAVIGCGWEVKGWWWRREGGAKERGRAKAKGRSNWLMAEVATSWEWAGSASWEPGSEWGKERNRWVSWKRKIDYEGKIEWVREREKRLLINNNKKTINNIIELE